MKTVLIVCGAGASSTFLASRMRTLAKTQNLPVVIEAASDIDLDSRLAHVDVLLVGPHLAAAYDGLHAKARGFGVSAALLPPTAFGPGGAEHAFDLVGLLLASTAVTGPTDTASLTEGFPHA